jgi:hypothetical protein
MAIVVRWKATGEYLIGLVVRHGCAEAEWRFDRRRAMRFESQAAAKKAVSAHFKGQWDEWSGLAKFIRLVPKRRAEQATDAVFLAGVAEGERRAKVKARATARGLVTRWEARERRMGTEAEAATERGDDLRAARCRATEGATLLCVNEARAAFNLPADDKPPTGKPVPDASGVVPEGGATEIAHGGVKVTAPVEMSLVDVWCALSSAPALRVCLDGETRLAREHGATEMRERAALFLEPFVGARIVAGVRALTLDGAPQAAPWRGIGHEVALDMLVDEQWRAEGVGDEGEVYIACFVGMRAEERAREYAAWVSGPDATGGGPGGKRAPCPGLHVDFEPCDLCADATPLVAPDRETLGREVHEVWAERGAGTAKWDERTEHSKELLRLAGESLFNMGARWTQQNTETSQ